MADETRIYSSAPLDAVGRGEECVRVVSEGAANLLKEPAKMAGMSWR